MAALPYRMFELARSAADARRFDRMESIYHRGQDLVWSGHDVLKELVSKHGAVRIPEHKKPALRAVFGPILWGELAAWNISAQLVDRLEPLEAKMAATSQAHDEARHFYVMHDYLELALGEAPKSIHRTGEKLLERVLEVDDLACKLLGMQLQVETTALTIFQASREANFCPVLTDLLLYFEKDEARHVGLGSQILPILIRSMDRVDALRLSAFALEITYRLIASNKVMEPELRELGIDPRRVLQLAKSKQMIVFEELWSATGKPALTVSDAIARVLEGVANGLWPPPGQEHLSARVRAFARAVALGIDRVDTTIHPE